MEPRIEETSAEKWKKENGLYWHEDMFVPAEVNPSLIGRIKSFKFDESDILISTYPRSGTTWSQELTWLVCNNADIETAKKVDRYTRAPFIEFTFKRLERPDVEFLEMTPPPRVIKTHFPPQYWETQRKAVGFKTIVVMRNLKDVMVSHFHFYNDLFNFTGTWDDFFEMFKKDEMVYGSWVKHCLKCWELRDDPNVLMLKYEKMKENPSANIRKMAEFCGKSLSEDQVSLIADFADFSKMKKREKGATEIQNENFFRKGVVGEWEAYFTKEQLEYVHNILKTTTEKEGLFFDTMSV